MIDVMVLDIEALLADRATFLRALAEYDEQEDMRAARRALVTHLSHRHAELSPDLEHRAGIKRRSEQWR
jgi:hypothetical protein